MASPPDPVNWSSYVLTWALRLLAAVVALRLAFWLLVGMAPVLIGVGCAVALLYAIYVIHKILRSRW
jgi:hypothetical protein